MYGKINHAAVQCTREEDGDEDLGSGFGLTENQLANANNRTVQRMIRPQTAVARTGSPVSYSVGSPPSFKFANTPDDARLERLEKRFDRIIDLLETKELGVKGQ